MLLQCHIGNLSSKIYHVRWAEKASFFLLFNSLFPVQSVELPNCNAIQNEMKLNDKERKNPTFCLWMWNSKFYLLLTFGFIANILFYPHTHTKKKHFCFKNGRNNNNNHFKKLQKLDKKNILDQRNNRSLDPPLLSNVLSVLIGSASGNKRNESNLNIQCWQILG